MKLHSVSELKASAGRILDRAISGKPQYVVRAGAVAVISKADLLAGVEEHPVGYFAHAYRDSDPEQLAFEAAMGKVRPPLSMLTRTHDQQRARLTSCRRSR